MRGKKDCCDAFFFHGPGSLCGVSELFDGFSRGFRGALRETSPKLNSFLGVHRKLALFPSFVEGKKLPKPTPFSRRPFGYDRRRRGSKAGYKAGSVPSSKKLFCPIRKGLKWDQLGSLAWLVKEQHISKIHACFQLERCYSYKPLKRIREQQKFAYNGYEIQDLIFRKILILVLTEIRLR